MFEICLLDADPGQTAIEPNRPSRRLASGFHGPLNRHRGYTPAAFGHGRNLNSYRPLMAFPTLSYETLDAIADSVNPTLGVIALAWPWLRWREQWRIPAVNVIVTLLSVAIAYALSALDGATGWWPSWGLDFSTHTAVCVALVVSLCSIKRSWSGLWVGVFAAYAALMVYQRYHSVGDIVTTAAVVAPFVIGLRWWAGWAREITAATE